MKGNIKSICAMLLLVVMCFSALGLGGVVKFAAASGVDINDMLNNQGQATAGTDASSTASESSSSDEQKKRNNDFINSIAAGTDYTQPESEEVKAFGEKVQTVTSWIVQGLVYLFTAFLVVSKLIDIIYVSIPFTRTALANGYMGNGAAAGTPGQANGMGGMGGFGGGMGGFGGGMGGFGMNRGYGGYGMNRGFGGMGGMGGSMMGGDAGMAAQNQPAHGRMQFVSNAALNAVATESVIGPDGKGQSAFKTYAKDMVISLIAAPVLIVLCATGAIANIGFAAGSFVADVLCNIKF